MFKFNNKDTRTTPMASFRYLYCQLGTYLTPFSSVPIVNFEQVIAGQAEYQQRFSQVPPKIFYKVLHHCYLRESGLSTVSNHDMIPLFHLLPSWYHHVEHYYCHKSTENCSQVAYRSPPTILVKQHSSTVIFL